MLDNNTHVSLDDLKQILVNNRHVGDDTVKEVMAQAELHAVPKPAAAKIRIEEIVDEISRSSGIDDLKKALEHVREVLEDRPTVQAAIPQEVTANLVGLFSYFKTDTAVSAIRAYVDSVNIWGRLLAILESLENLKEELKESIEELAEVIEEEKPEEIAKTISHEVKTGIYELIGILLWQMATRGLINREWTSPSELPTDVRRILDEFIAGYRWNTTAEATI